MQIVRELSALRAAVAAWRAEGVRVALVPTMGALHAGHLALVEAARRPGTRVVASIFVNPTQFGPNEDLSRYPRKEVADLKMLTDAGCDLAWLPTVEEMYPAGFATTVRVAGALYELGVFYSTGTGGADYNLIEAHKWFNLAAVAGHGPAQEARGEIADDMTAREIATAQAAARAFLQSTRRLAA